MGQPSLWSSSPSLHSGYGHAPGRPAVDGQNIQSLDNFTPPTPPKFQSCFLLPRIETGGQKKSNPQHDMSRTRCLTLTFGDGGVMPIFSSGFQDFAHLRYNSSVCIARTRHVQHQIQFVVQLLRLAISTSTKKTFNCKGTDGLTDLPWLSMSLHQVLPATSCIACTLITKFERVLKNKKRNCDRL